MTMEDKNNTMESALSFPIETTTHELNSTWAIWAHLPHDTDWTIKSYKKIWQDKF